jgi:hypothetical protein
MTDYNHLITPPEELMRKWVRNASFVNAPPGTCPSTRKIAIQASNWGWQQRDASVSNELQEARDEELGACVESISKFYGEKSLVISLLLADRRPKPKSKKEQALEDFDFLMSQEGLESSSLDTCARARRVLQALESLPD